MMSDREDLHGFLVFPKDDAEREATESNTANGWGQRDSVPARCFAGSVECGKERAVITLSETRRATFIVGDLFLMLQRRFGMERILHFRRA